MFFLCVLQSLGSVGARRFASVYIVLLFVYVVVGYTVRPEALQTRIPSLLLKVSPSPTLFYTSNDLPAIPPHKWPT